MNWTESNLMAIATKRLFYFENELSSTCARICKRLDIEILPDYTGELYFKYDTITDSWEKKTVDENQRVTSDTLIFDKELNSKFQSSPSQILFVFDRSVFQGIVHFTDYGKRVVYHDLYKNFFEFEKKLKELLILKGFGADSFISYFQYKADKYPKDADKYLEKKKKVETEKANYPLDTLFTIDLLEFCYSSFHDINNSKKPFIIKDTEKTGINRLRNIIMHNKDNTGISSTMPHNYSRFSTDFFEHAQLFKTIFWELNREIETFNVAQKPILNKIWLGNLDKLSDSELHRLFFDYEKYV